MAVHSNLGLAVEREEKIQYVRRQPVWRQARVQFALR